MKKITLWNVPVERALKIADLMKEEANAALMNDDYEAVENLMYEIRKLLEDIDEAREMED